MSTSKDVYPRFNVWDIHDERVGYRVSERRMNELSAEASALGGTVLATYFHFPPRFRVKMDPASRQPVILADRSRPAYRGRFYTFERAMLEMDNIVRRERNMPIRFGWITIVGELGRAIAAPLPLPEAMRALETNR